MLTYHQIPVSVSLISIDLPLWHTFKTDATLEQKDQQRFHLLLNEPAPPEWKPEIAKDGNCHQPKSESSRFLWLEISPYRVSMTMQEQGKLSYRHLWQQGVYGVSRYCLQKDSLEGYRSLQLRNYTRSVELDGCPVPHNLRLEYELWSEKFRLGHYILHLQIEH
ncbi:MAG: hypothetical protein F6K36_04170 [Symploca sp. SIO3C6]|nr:hypothetical protein [Symploca sp. SIO3C6]